MKISAKSLSALLGFCVAIPLPVGAASIFEIVVSSTSYAPPKTVRRVPFNSFHLNPIHGFGSIQAVDGNVNNGEGLAVHSKADLVPGDTLTRTDTRAAIELMVQPADITMGIIDIPVTIRGAYAVTPGSTVSAGIQRNVINGPGTPYLSNLFNLVNPSTGSLDVGIWEVTTILTTSTTYILSLQSSALAFDVTSNGTRFFQPSGAAFIDPVISAASGEPEIVLQFDSDGLITNPDYIVPTIPEPGSSMVLFAVALGSVLRRKRLS